MKNVELTRARIVQGFTSELRRVKSWLSSVGGMQEQVERLEGRVGDTAIAALTEALLEHLGHETAVKTTDDARGSESTAMRAVRRGR